MTGAGARNEVLGRRLGIAAWLACGLVYVVTGVMHRPEFHVVLPPGWSTAALPAFHASVNALTALVLVAGWLFIRRGRADLHRRAMWLALGLSAVFLVSYVAYHFTAAEVRYGDVDHDGKVSAAEIAAAGWLRPAYLFLLLSHIGLAALALPLVLHAWAAACAGDFARHRRLVRFAYPLWLFVAVSGPVCYLMLRPYL